MWFRVLAACATMAVKDSLGTLLVIAEARGRAWLAGCLDAAMDRAADLSLVFGIGVVLLHGFTGETAVTLTAMSVTSIGVTQVATRWGRRL